MIKFNINDAVLVKLTPFGKNVFENRERATTHQVRLAGAKDYQGHKLEEDEQGYSRWQMWVLMHYFGESLIMGSPALFENMEILIPVPEVQTKPTLSLGDITYPETSECWACDSGFFPHRPTVLLGDGHSMCLSCYVKNGRPVEDYVAATAFKKSIGLQIEFYEKKLQELKHEK